MKYCDYGVVTTPLVHYMVLSANYPEEYGASVQSTYYNTLATAFKNIMTMVWFRLCYLNMKQLFLVFKGLCLNKLLLCCSTQPLEPTNPR